MIKTTCLDNRGYTIHWLTQWDVNQKLIVYIENYDLSIPPVVHFCNKHTGKTWNVTSTVKRTKEENKYEGIANIPNKFLEEATPLFAYVYLTDANETESKKTILFIEIPVRKRQPPNDYPCSSDIEVIEINDKINEIEKLIKEIEDLNLSEKIAQLLLILERFRLYIATVQETDEYLKGLSGVSILEGSGKK